MDGHADQPKTAARIAEAERMLLDGESVPIVRRTISERHELGERQARTIVSEACDRVADVWNLQRPQLIACRLVQLENLARLAIEKGQLKTALNAWQHADALMQLISKATRK
jgi:hypothetical protein